MKYTVEFEIQTDHSDTVNAWVHKTLMYTFGSIDGFVTPVMTYRPVGCHAHGNHGEEN